MTAQPTGVDVDELLQLRGVVAAGPDAVAALLPEVLDARPGPGVTVTVTERSVTVQGEWWYRGVTEVLPGEDGSLVVHHVYNIAEGRKWAVRMVSRGPLLAAPETFRKQIEELGRRLGCESRVLPGS